MRCDRYEREWLDVGVEAQIKRLESGFGEWVVQHRWWIIFLWTLLVFCNGSGQA